jgi:hypothetical protein
VILPGRRVTEDYSALWLDTVLRETGRAVFNRVVSDGTILLSTFSVFVSCRTV